MSLLQECGMRRGKTPLYDLLKAEEQAGQPNFTFSVSVGEISCTGQGPSKKAAKHKAAEAALKILKGGFGGCCAVGGTSEQSESHPVSVLQMLVHQKILHWPEYTGQESGPGHRKKFTMTCKVGPFVEIGSGTSKKLAKRNAAIKMLSRIHDEENALTRGLNYNPPDGQFQGIFRRLMVRCGFSPSGL